MAVGSFILMVGWSAWNEAHFADHGTTETQETSARSFWAVAAIAALLAAGWLLAARRFERPALRRLWWVDAAMAMVAALAFDAWMRPVRGAYLELGFFVHWGILLAIAMLWSILLVVASAAARRDTMGMGRLYGALHVTVAVGALAPLAWALVALWNTP